MFIEPAIGKEKTMKRHPYLIAAVFFWFLASTAAFATTVVSQTRMTNTPNNNVQETSIVGHTNAAGMEVTTSAYMQYIDSNTDRTWVYTVTKTPSVQTSKVVLNTLDSAGDPVLAVNPYGD